MGKQRWVVYTLVRLEGLECWQHLPQADWIESEDDLTANEVKRWLLTELRNAGLTGGKAVRTSLATPMSQMDGTTMSRIAERDKIDSGEVANVSRVPVISGP